MFRPEPNISFQRFFTACSQCVDLDLHNLSLLLIVLLLSLSLSLSYVNKSSQASIGAIAKIKKLPSLIDLFFLHHRTFRETVSLPNPKVFETNKKG